ncbi:MAG: hypothetical protein ACLFMO_07745 [Eubacteriales bacterium]
MNKLIKRIVAIIVVVILLGLYFVSLVAVLLNKDYATDLLLWTILITAVLSVFMFIIRRFHLFSPLEIGSSGSSKKEDD